MEGQRSNRLTCREHPRLQHDRCVDRVIPPAVVPVGDRPEPGPANQIGDNVDVAGPA